MATEPTNEIIEGLTRDQWLDRLTERFAAMRCTMWGGARSNWRDKDRRANAEFVLDLVRSALGYEDAEDEGVAEYLANQRQVTLAISWQPDMVADQAVIDVISEAHDNLIDALCELGVNDLSGGGTIVRADGSWSTGSEGDA